MAQFIKAMTDSWRKNWPEVRCALSGGIPRFVFAHQPKYPLPGVPVFHYHVVDAAHFRADLEFLQRNGNLTATADMLLDHMQKRIALPEKAVVLSFDDGPANLFNIAFPLLEQFNAHAVAFVAPNLHTDDLPIEREDRPCTWSELQTMARSGLVDVQAHTLEHRYIPRWPEPVPLTGVHPSFVDRARQPSLTMEEDFRRARQEIEQRLSKPVHHMAFPQYDATALGVRAAQSAGYRGLWRGVLPHRPANAPGDPPSTIVRLSGEFLRRLPGKGRLALSAIMCRRYAKRAQQRGNDIGRSSQPSTPVAMEARW